MHALPYLTRCIKETLRLHSPVPFISRQLDKPMDLEGVHLKENTIIDINIYALHHNPQVWGDNHMVNMGHDIEYSCGIGVLHNCFRKFYEQI